MSHVPSLFYAVRVLGRAWADQSVTPESNRPDIDPRLLVFRNGPPRRLQRRRLRVTLVEPSDDRPRTKQKRTTINRCALILYQTGAPGLEPGTFRLTVGFSEYPLNAHK